MNLCQKSIFVWMVTGAQWLALGQTAPAQGAAQDQTTQNQTIPDQTLPGQSAGSDESGRVRTAPAAALSARAGLQSDSGEGEDTFLELPQIPALLGGRGMSLAFPGEMERSNYLRGGVNIGAAYDDNPLLLSSHEVGNVSGSVFPNLSIEQTTSRTRWTLGYAGGLTVNQRFTSENQGSHDLSFDSQFRLSPHVNLRVAENFLMRTGVFDTGSGGSGVGGAGNPNASLLAPLATQRSTLTTVEANYHFALNDLVGASASFYNLNFSNVPQGEQLSDGQTATGAGFWLHRFFRGNWGGASYRFQRITYDPNGETRVDDLMAVDMLRLTNHLSVNGFVGPEYVNDQGLAPGATAASQSSQWSVAGGVEGGWQNAKTSLTAGYSRTISDGAGVLGAVRLQNVHAAFRREFVPGWAGTVTVSRGTNRSLTVPYAGSASSVNLTSAGVGLERNVGKGLALHVSYTHDFQQQLLLSGAAMATPQWLDAHRNRFAATLSYQWSKPLGI
jgi:hypothetical protein